MPRHADQARGSVERAAKRRFSRLQPIGSLITGALPVRARAHLAGWRAVEIWPEVAGPDGAARSTAVAYRDGRLIVEVSTSVWMHHLGACKRNLLDTLTRRLGRGVVNDILFRIRVDSR